MRWAYAVLLVALAAGMTGAQEERSIDRFAGVGVRAMAMGGAFTGVADDFTALYWNPAGLAQIRDNRFHAAVQRGSRENTARLDATEATSSLDNTRFSGLGVVFPYPVYRGSLVFAAGMIRTQDFDWSLRQQGPDPDTELHTDFRFEHQGGITLTGLAAAVDVSPVLSLGLTLGITRGEDDSINEFTWVDTEDQYIQERFLARESFRDDYRTAFHAVLGGMLRMPRARPRVRLGAAVAAGTTRKISYTFQGLSDWRGYNVVEYDDGTVLQNVVIEPDGSVTDVPVENLKASYRLSLPLELSLGGSVDAGRGLLLAASAHFAEWEQTQYEGTDEYQLRAGEDFRTQYRNVIRYHFGAEWRVPVVALDLRAGYYTDPIPFVGPRDPELAVDPVSNPEIVIAQDRRFVTLGGGLLVDRVLQLDLAWTHGSFEQREGSLTEDHTLNRVLVGVGYRF